MPSPFPGMDPYLEGSLWTTFHFAFGAELVRQLAPRLRPRYLALPVERLVLEEAGDIAVMTSNLYPDVSVMTHQPPVIADRDVAAVEPPLQLATIIPQAVPHVSIEIRDVAQRQLVTAIEILSPTNKRGEGRLEYLAKRRRLLLSSAHLIELDLLREGQRVPMQQPLPSAPYFILISRAERRPLLDIWPVPIDQPLPVIPIPLLPGDADLLLDLQATFTATYDLLGYDLVIDYHQPPDPPLSATTAEWAAALLHERGAGYGATG
jgi:Protein of unknown function (DUF4058)